MVQTLGSLASERIWQTYKDNFELNSGRSQQTLISQQTLLKRPCASSSAHIRPVWSINHYLYIIPAVGALVHELKVHQKLVCACFPY